MMPKGGFSGRQEQPTAPRLHFHPGDASCPMALAPPAPEPKTKVRTQPPLIRRGKNEGVGEEKLNRNLGPLLTGSKDGQTEWAARIYGKVGEQVVGTKWMEEKTMNGGHETAEARGEDAEEHGVWGHCPSTVPVRA